MRLQKWACVTFPLTGFVFLFLVFFSPSAFCCLVPRSWSPENQTSRTSAHAITEPLSSSLAQPTTPPTSVMHQSTHLYIHPCLDTWTTRHTSVLQHCYIYIFADKTHCIQSFMILEPPRILDAIFYAWTLPTPNSHRTFDSWIFCIFSLALCL